MYSNSATLAATAAPFQFNAQLAGDITRLVTLSGTPAGPDPEAILRDARGLLEAGLRAVNTNDPRYTSATVQLIGRNPNARFAC